MILISIIIYIIAGRPILFKHRRCGFNYKEFNVLKFRTMHINNGSDITKYNDKRITKIGKILRMLKIDEFPQLINNNTIEPITNAFTKFDLSPDK